MLAIRPARYLLKENIKLFPNEFFKQYHKKKTEKVVPVGSSFSVVYKLSPISVCSIVNKLKKFQLIAVGVGTPIIFGLQALQVWDNSIPVAFASVAFASTFAIFSIGQMFTNLVGMAYVSKDRSRVKISYLDFWGARQDKIVSSDEIVGITKNSFVPWDSLNMSDDKTKYKISFRFGEITMTPLFKIALKHDPDVHASET